MEPVSLRSFLTRPKYLVKNEIQQSVASGFWARFSQIPVGFIGISLRCILSYLFSRKKLPLDSGNTVLFWSSYFSEEKSLSPYPLPMARSTSSDLWPSVCFSSCIVLSSCGAVSTGPEDTSETILVVLVDGLKSNVTCDYSPALRHCREGFTDAFEHRFEFAVIFF